MPIGLWGWILAAVALALWLASPVGIDLRYRRGPQTGLGRISVSIWWIILALRWSFRWGDDPPRRVGRPGAVAALLVRADRARAAVRSVAPTLWRHVSVRRLEIAARLGAGDPSATGTLIGLLWAIWGAGLATMRRWPAFRHTRARFELRPDMLGARLDFDFRCIAAVRLLHIISAVPRFLSVYLSARGTSKGAARAWPNTRFRAS